MAKTLSGMSGGRFRIELDECFKFEKPETKRADRRWYERIPLLCGGFICIQKESPPQLKLWTPKGRKTVVKIYEQFKKNKQVILNIEFSGFEAELFFPPKLLVEIGELARARKKRRLSPEAKEKALASLQKANKTRTQTAAKAQK